MNVVVNMKYDSKEGNSIRSLGDEGWQHSFVKVDYSSHNLADWVTKGKYLDLFVVTSSYISDMGSDLWHFFTLQEAKQFVDEMNEQQGRYDDVVKLSDYEWEYHLRFDKEGGAVGYVEITPLHIPLADVMRHSN